MAPLRRSVGVCQVGKGGGHLRPQEKINEAEAFGWARLHWTSITRQRALGLEQLDGTLLSKEMTCSDPCGRVKKG